MDRENIRPFMHRDTIRPLIHPENIRPLIRREKGVFRPKGCNRSWWSVQTRKISQQEKKSDRWCTQTRSDCWPTEKRHDLSSTEKDPTIGLHRWWKIRPLKIRPLMRREKYYERLKSIDDDPYRQGTYPNVNDDVDRENIRPLMHRNKIRPLIHR